MARKSTTKRDEIATLFTSNAAVDRMADSVYASTEMRRHWSEVRFVLAKEVYGREGFLQQVARVRGSAARIALSEHVALVDFVCGHHDKAERAKRFLEGSTGMNQEMLSEFKESVTRHFNMLSRSGDVRLARTNSSVGREVRAGVVAADRRPHVGGMRPSGG